VVARPPLLFAQAKDASCVIYRIDFPRVILEDTAEENSVPVKNIGWKFR